MRRIVSIAVLLAALGGATATADAKPKAPTDLTVGDRARPLNVEGAPQFGWMGAGGLQRAYEIRVTRGRDEVWDSGRVESSDQSYVGYAGPALTPGMPYEWTVRTWDEHGEASPWSRTAEFDTGLGDADWSGASWIRRVTTGNDFADDYTLARKEAAVGGSPVTRARAYVSALGQYELHVNGRGVYRGDSFGYPGEGQYSATDITHDVKAGRPLALGVLYHYWTCTCQGRANGRVSNTTLAAAAPLGATNLKVSSVLPFDEGDELTVGTGSATDTATITSVGTAGASGTGITIDRPLSRPYASGNAGPVYDHKGPSGLLVKVVVDHADGSSETIVSDGAWKVAKAAQYTNATTTRRNGDAGDWLERYDARLETAGWDAAGFDDTGWQAPAVIGPHPRPVERLRDTFSHLDPVVSDLAFDTVHPKRVVRLADGTVVADFGVVIPAAPQVRLADGTDGRTLSMRTSYRLNNARLSAPAAAGDTAIGVTSTSGFSAGDPVTVDAPANGHGAGDPERRTVVSAAGGQIVLDAPLERTHAADAWVEGSRAGTSGLDTQGSNMGWFYTEKAGAQTARTFTHWGWRYLQIDDPGEALDATDISAIVQHSEVPRERQATFKSDDKTLDAVFELMQRSGLYSSQETFVDTPTREKGQFLGDTVDQSFANMTASGERNATARAIREFVYSGSHSWKAASSNYCTSAQVPCSFASIETPGRLGAVYPNGDNMRDIPDYTEMFPDWVARYYEQTGDRATLAAAYPAMRAAAEYIRAAQGSTGLVTDLPGGAGPYLHGIIDWPAPMRYGYTFDGNAARTIHNAEAVGAYRAVAAAAGALGHQGDAAQYGHWADELSDTINARLRRPDGLYSDGLTSGGTQIDNAAQHAQTYPIYYGVAPKDAVGTLADRIAAQGMQQGPMTWHKLLDALAIAGRDDQVVSLLTDAKADGPAKILAENGTFMWEQWNPGCATAPCTTPISESNSESFSHGWGSWGVVDMVETLLGVRVTSAGAATIAVEPPALHGDRLRKLRGSAWTQRGTVPVAWERKASGMTLSLTVPPNVTARVAIPVDGRPRYKVSGKADARFEGYQDGRAVFTVGPGDARFAPEH
jgi:hypothetical protein